MLLGQKKKKNTTNGSYSILFNGLFDDPPRSDCIPWWMYKTLNTNKKSYYDIKGKTSFRIFRGSRMLILQRLQPLTTAIAMVAVEWNAYTSQVYLTVFSTIFRNSFSLCLRKLLSLWKNDFFKVPTRHQLGRKLQSEKAYMVLLFFFFFLYHPILSAIVRRTK